MIHVSVDGNRCQGHARCFAYAPDVFDMDDEGYALVREGSASLSESNAALRLAEANCPERAVLVTTD